MVFFEKPVMRTMERIEQPSTRAATIWVRSSVVNRLEVLQSWERG